ncbi:MAG: DUF4397 domain-containing protein [Thermomicrobiales bacterium]
MVQGRLFGPRGVIDPVTTRRAALAAFAAAATASLVGPGVALGKNKKKCAKCCKKGKKNQSRVRVVHASPNAPNVDVYVDDALAIENLAFGKATALLQIPAGEHNVKVTPAGETTPFVIDEDVVLDGCASYEVSATGLLVDIEAQVYPIPRTRLGKKTARVRIIHNSPGAPAVDVKVAGTDIFLAKNLAFPNAANPVEVPAGTYDVQVLVANTSTVVLTVPDVQLKSGQVYDIFAIGLVAGNPAFTVLPLIAKACCGRGPAPEE